MNFRKAVFVDRERYIRHYGNWFRGTPTEYWTVDVDPEAAAWGEPGRHLTYDVQEIDAGMPPGGVDIVFMNGVLGFVMNAKPAKEHAVAALRRVLRPGGTLMVRWNDNPPNKDPKELDNINSLFGFRSTLPLSRRIQTPGTFHVFEFLSVR